MMFHHSGTPMIGGVLLWMAAGSCLLAILSYLVNHATGRLFALKLARTMYHATAVGVVAASALLLYLILTHQFQFTYVWSYSSRDLSFPLLVSTFYAGQEGSFLLWSLFTVAIGVLLLRYTSRKGLEPQVMAVYGSINLALLVLLLVKSPFLRVWETWPGDVPAGFVPPEGRGLNPLLQNYWMVIHPQVLFSGFAAMSVPYAYAVAALLKRDYNSWIRPATPWLAFGILVLGTGIIMGGFWAYETLGWGGYWAWDPVENSSLVPWLVAVAALHTLLSQRKNGSFIRTNLVLSMLCFVLVLYSTFLTRSGVLGETSVHSFVDPGMLAYHVLLGTISVFLLAGAVLLALRWREIPRATVQHAILSREFALFLGAFLLVAAALWIIAGTSSPMITDILEGKKSAMDISYYSRLSPALGIGLALLAGIGQLLWWTRSDRGAFLRTIGPPVALSALVALASIPLGVRSVYLLLFVLAAAFALFSNVQVALRIVKGNPKFSGGSVAHIGLAIMFLGFVASSEFDLKETASLPQGVPVEVLGYTLTYKGVRSAGEGKTAHAIAVERDGRQFEVAPTVYFSQYTQNEIRNPDIANLILRDFYVAPLGIQAPEVGNESSRFRQGETRQLGGVDVTFLGLEKPLIERASEGAWQGARARLMVREPGQRPVILSPGVTQRGERSTATYAGLLEFTLLGVDSEPSRGTFSADIGVRTLRALDNTPVQPVLIVEASIKPLINLVWAGVIILLVGVAVTIYRRGQEATLRGET